MKRKLTLIILALISSLNVFSQCEIKSKLDATGILYYSADPVKVFWTQAKSLYCGAFTDDESFYLQFYPEPFPEKKKKKKTLKEPAFVTLVNGERYELDFFDSRYISEDTIFVMQYLIPDDAVDKFLEFEMTIVSIHVGDEAGYREYKLKLHKNAIREQLKCLMKREKK